MPYQAPCPSFLALLLSRVSLQVICLFLLRLSFLSPGPSKMSLVSIRPLPSTLILIFPNLFLGTWSVCVHLWMPSKIRWSNIYPNSWICPVDFSDLPSAHIMVGSSRLSSKETPYGALISPISKLASFFPHKSSLTINLPDPADVTIGEPVCRAWNLSTCASPCSNKHLHACLVCKCSEHTAVSCPKHNCSPQCQWNHPPH